MGSQRLVKVVLRCQNQDAFLKCAVGARNFSEQCGVQTTHQPAQRVRPNRKRILGERLNEALTKGEAREAHRLWMLLAGRGMGARRRNLARIPAAKQCSTERAKTLEQHIDKGGCKRFAKYFQQWSRKDERTIWPIVVDENAMLQDTDWNCGHQGAESAAAGRRVAAVSPVLLAIDESLPSRFQPCLEHGRAGRTRDPQGPSANVKSPKETTQAEQLLDPRRSGTSCGRTWKAKKTHGQARTWTTMKESLPTEQHPAQNAGAPSTVLGKTKKDDDRLPEEISAPRMSWCLSQGCSEPRLCRWDFELRTRYWHFWRRQRWRISLLSCHPWWAVDCLLLV